MSATEETHSYKEVLSPSEEKDLETLLGSTDITVTDIDELSSKLSIQLAQLELVSVFFAVMFVYFIFGNNVLLLGQHRWFDRIRTSCAGYHQEIGGGIAAVRSCGYMAELL